MGINQIKDKFGHVYA